MWIGWIEQIWEFFIAGCYVVFKFFQNSSCKNLSGTCSIWMVEDLNQSYGWDVSAWKAWADRIVGSAKINICSMRYQKAIFFGNYLGFYLPNHGFESLWETRFFNVNYKMFSKKWSTKLTQSLSCQTSNEKYAKGPIKPLPYINFLWITRAPCYLVSEVCTQLLGWVWGKRGGKVASFGTKSPYFKPNFPQEAFNSHSILPTGV